MKEELYIFQFWEVFYMETEESAKYEALAQCPFLPSKQTEIVIRFS